LITTYWNGRANQLGRLSAESAIAGKKDAIAAQKQNAILFDREYDAREYDDDVVNW
jgi:hypothetical protein